MENPFPEPARLEPAAQEPLVVLDAPDAPEPVARVGLAERAATLWHGHRTELLIALLVGAVGVALGGPVGLLWRAVAPTVPMVKTQYGWYPTEAEPEGYIADDLWFAGLGLAAGVLLALGAWYLARRVRGPVVLVVMVAGAFAGALLAAWLGHRIGLSGYQSQVHTAADGARLQRLVALRSDVARLVAPLAAAVVYLLLASFHYAPSLRDGDYGDYGDVDVDPDPAAGPDPAAVDPGPDPTAADPDRAAGGGVAGWQGHRPDNVSSAPSVSPGP